MCPSPTVQAPLFCSSSSRLSHTLLTALLPSLLPPYLLDPQPHFLQLLGLYPLESCWARGFNRVFWREHGPKGSLLPPTPPLPPPHTPPRPVRQLRGQLPHHIPTL